MFLKSKTNSSPTNNKTLWGGVGNRAYLYRHLWGRCLEDVYWIKIVHLFLKESLATDFINTESWRYQSSFSRFGILEPKVKHKDSLILFLKKIKSLLNLLKYCFCFMVCCFFFPFASRHVGSYPPHQGLNLHPCVGRWSLNHWTAMEVPSLF